MTKIWNAGDEITHDDLNETGGGFHARPQDTPDLTLKVGAGVAVINGTVVKYAGGNSPSFTAPSSNPRIDLLTIDSSGTLARTAGSEGASPSAPSYPVDKLVICEVYNKVGQTQIFRDDQGSGKGYILRDARAFVLGATAIDHSTGASDAGKQIKTDSAGLIDETFMRNSITRGPYTTHESLDGSTTPQPVVYDTSTNIIKASKASSSDTSRNKFFGFIKTAMNVFGWVSALDYQQYVNSGSTGSETYSYTLKAGNNRLLIVVVSGGTSLSVSGVSFNGSALTLLKTQNNLSVWYKMMGSSGSDTTANVVITGSMSSNDFLALTQTLKDVDQSSPMTNTGSNSASTLSVSAVDQGILFGIRLDESPTASTGQTKVDGRTWGNAHASTWIQNLIASGSTAMTFTGASGFILLALNSVAWSYPTGNAQLAGVVSGFSGLTIGATYYIQDAGGIGTSAGTASIKIGVAISATEILIDRAT